MLRTFGLFAAVLLVLLARFAIGEPPVGHSKEMPEFALFPPAEIKWTDGPAVLPAGAKMAVLEGDPSKEGPFVLRLRMPNGYRVPPHTHPKTERLTVISGTFNLGMGDKFVASQKP